MEREHRKREHREGGSTEPDRPQGESRGRAARRGASEDRELLGSDEDSLRDEDEDAAEDEDAGARAAAATGGSSPSVIKQQIRNAWEAVRENEASIARGIYDRLKEQPGADKRSAGFFGTLFNGLAGVGVAQLLSSLHPGTAVGATLIAVFDAAKTSVAAKLPSAGSRSKIVHSDFIEQYVRHINAGWLQGADLLETRMDRYSKKRLLSLRSHMRSLARKSNVDNGTIQDKMLNAWMRALNQEHKQEEKSNDFATETSGRLHLTGVDIRPPPPGQPEKGFDERIFSLSASLDGTGTLRNRLLTRRLHGVGVPVTVAGNVPEWGDFSFGIGPSDRAPKPGPTEENARFALRRYASDEDWTAALPKIWNKMKNHTVDELVGTRKSGGKTDQIQGSRND